LGGRDEHHTSRFPGLFGRKGKERRIRLCPRCGSRSIEYSSKWDGWLTPVVYLCGECGYRGPIYLEMTEEEYLEWMEEKD
jgi:predicted RNA-binding Zn-ribbon protein involved in translation (DUF1610 family)